MKISKKDRKQLEMVLEQLSRAQSYILSPRVEGIAVSTEWPNGSSYSTTKELADMFHKGVTAVNVTDKHIGSDITGLYQAHKMLSSLLAD